MNLEDRERIANGVKKELRRAFPKLIFTVKVELNVIDFYNNILVRVDSKALGTFMSSMAFDDLMPEGALINSLSRSVEYQFTNYIKENIT